MSANEQKLYGANPCGTPLSSSRAHACLYHRADSASIVILRRRPVLSRQAAA